MMVVLKIVAINDFFRGVVLVVIVIELGLEIAGSMFGDSLVSDKLV